MTSDKYRLKQHYFSFATQYYISGRFGAFAMLLPTCGNLFHHAIELYLKGYLSVTLTEGELRELRHRLDKAWKAFREEANDPTLDEFDELILTLNKFEDIRYPDEIAEGGAMIFIDIGKDDKSYIKTERKEPEYRINVGQIDALVKIIFAKARFNPSFFMLGLNKNATGYLKKLNKERVWL